MTLRGPKCRRQSRRYTPRSLLHEVKPVFPAPAEPPPPSPRPPPSPIPAEAMSIFLRWEDAVRARRHGEAEDLLEKLRELARKSLF